MITACSSRPVRRSEPANALPAIAGQACKSPGAAARGRDYISAGRARAGRAKTKSAIISVLFFCNKIECRYRARPPLKGGARRFLFNRTLFRHINVLYSQKITAACFIIVL